MRALATVGAALALVALLPDTAWAWTPGTHVFLGDAVLRSLTLLPPAIGDLLRAFPHEFLYGSIAADTSIAKKYAPAGRHCHSWNVGFEIHDAARDEPLRSFGLGYLSHLAADAVAHSTSCHASSRSRRQPKASDTAIGRAGLRRTLAIAPAFEPAT